MVDNLYYVKYPAQSTALRRRLRPVYRSPARVTRRRSHESGFEIAESHLVDPAIMNQLFKLAFDTLPSSRPSAPEAAAVETDPAISEPRALE
jgi:hypothetical protein